MSEDFRVTIYHNPDCATSRNSLAMIRAAGYAPTVVEYLKVGWTRAQLEQVMAKIGLGPRGLLREKGTPAAQLGLLDDRVTDEALLSAMTDHPILVNRPIVLAPKGCALCRPSERVFDLLERRPSTFTKEDGEVVRTGPPTDP